TPQPQPVVDIGRRSRQTTRQPRTHSNHGARTVSHKTFCLAAAILLTTTLNVLAADTYTIPPARKNHWAWQPPTRSVPPEARNRAWVRAPIDAFALAKLEAAGFPPAPPATREQLIRRATLHLTGLPPTPAEIDAFVADTSPNAWEKVI